MPRATRKQIEASTTSHAVHNPADMPQRKQAPARKLGFYTSDSPKQPQGTPGAFGRDSGPDVMVKPNGSVVLAQDSRDRYWRALAKQVSHGAAVRVTVR